MAIIINDNLAVNAGKPVDSKYMNISTPWSGVTHANTNIPSSYRYLGLTVNVNNVEYWYKDSIADGGLVIKSLGGTLTGATNGIHLTAGGTSVALGGALTGNTVFNGGIVTKYSLQYGGDYSSNFTNRSLVDKAYVDGLASGLQPKQAVAVATTGNLTYLSGLTTIDSVPLTTGMRVLVKDQINQVDNGVYSASTGNWGRTADFDGTPPSEVITGSYMWALSGTTNMNTAWVLTTPDPVVVGVSALTFVFFSTVQDVLAGVGIIVSAVTGNHVVIFDGANVAGSGLGWDSGLGKLYTNDLDPDLLTGATNGLTKSGKNVILGGTLTGNTFIELPTGVKRSFIVGQDAANWHGGRVEVCTDTAVSGDTAFIGARHDSACYSQISITAMSGMTMASCYTDGAYGTSHSVRLGNRALEYGGNYCSDFYTNPRSIPDVGFVTGQTGSLSASNGLKRIGNNIVLGGILTGNTLISGGTKSFCIGSTASPLSAFRTCSISSTINTSGNSTISSSVGRIALNSGAASSGVTITSPVTGAVYSTDYSAGFVNNSLVTKKYVDNKVVSSTGGTLFTSNIVVSIATGKTFGQYRNGDTIYASGKTANWVILDALNEKLKPTLKLTSAADVINFGQPSKVVNLSFSYTANTAGALINAASAKVEYNRGAGWITLTTTTLTPTGYTHSINDSGNRFNTTPITYRYTVVDSKGGSGYTTYVVSPQTYAAPTITPTYTGSVLSYETQTSREVGNKNTDVAGNITSNRSLVNITGYTIQRNVNGGGWTTLTTVTFAGVLSKTITTYNDTSAAVGATSIQYRIVVNDEYISNTSSIYTIGLQYASYYGYSTNTLLNSAQILALGNQGLLPSRVRTMVLTAPVSNYTYVSYPASYGDLTSAIMDGAAPVLGAFTKLTAVSVTNNYGQAVSNNVYKSNATNAFTANSVAFA